MNITSAPFAHLTGVGSFVPTAEESLALRQYVEAGGVLLIDRCGGTSSFDPAAAKGVLETAFTGLNRHTLTSEDPLLRGDQNGMDELVKVRSRSYLAELKVLGQRSSPAQATPPYIICVGKGHVLYAPIDITCGMLGVNTWGIAGYEPTYAESLVKNALIWTSNGQPDQ